MGSTVFMVRPYCETHSNLRADYTTLGLACFASVWLFGGLGITGVGAYYL